jgi:hypothetical protein
VDNRQALGSSQHTPADNPADLLYSTYLGGSGNKYADAIVLDSAGSAYVAGLTLSSSFPTTPGAFDTSHSGGWSDAIVAKLATIEVPAPTRTPTSTPTVTPLGPWANWVDGDLPLLVRGRLALATFCSSL